ncbi:hypothetical protein G6F64_014567 [Rhizopus arrhizus]|uniref:Uncharacterized protein n=1 Tax=Rhizopus oryzae TaxID=64495 RepID=A0A9P7BJG6_RHIOR|nr:hypothetical protein G6F64_014567 [Rhizopus arrhizus]
MAWTMAATTSRHGRSFFHLRLARRRRLGRTDAAGACEAALQDAVKAQVVQEPGAHEACEDLAQHADGDQRQQDGADEVVIKALEGREQRAPTPPAPTIPTMVELRRLESNW